jgi:diadenosine tetraphosphate (Ap4A) HIT family hydrolase
VTDCPICARGQPLNVVAELPASWLTAPPEIPLPGYLCLVARTHVREPFELPGPERRAFWDDVDRVAQITAELARPDKLNYEIHGNTLEHLHLHLFPRSRGDRFAGRPIDWRDRIPRTAEDRATVIAIAARLARSTATG